MQALILAAGKGTRLKKLTKENPKSMVKINETTLIKRMLDILDKKSLNQIIILTGYKNDLLKNYINSLGLKTKLKFINNDNYDSTNNIYSMFLAKNEMVNDDTLTLESDLIFDEEIIDELLSDDRKNLALVSKYENWMDGSCLKIDEKEKITHFISNKDFDYDEANQYYKTVNIYKFSKEFSQLTYFPFLEALISSRGKNDYYEDVLKLIVPLNNNLMFAKILSKDHKWYEIDDEADLNIAESIFSKGEDKLIRFQNRYGGYWRYPKLLDFCYLVNPFFPPKKMVEELKYNFKTLLEQYPSGLEVNSNLCAKIYGIKKERVVVGNGAAELIKSLMEGMEGKIGFVRPTFEEYPNRYPNLKSVIYTPKNDEFSYTVKDLMNFFEDKDIKGLILINPDNPTGNYIPKSDVIDLIYWAKKREIVLIYDESFSDFADEENNTLVSDEFLELYEKLIVIKSISKSYGIPGCRLGFLCSSNENLIKNIKKSVSIWNINSFGEYYLQIFEKYKKDYFIALKCIKNARKNFVKKLLEIKEFRIIPSQANYLTIEVLKGTSKNLCIKMLDKNIFIKDLTSKIGFTDRQFIRVAVRNETDNNLFIEAVKAYFDKF
ncbi:aminotransferase class I/II-fold pyridoxal phosphate-dependent enzyme [Mycoplasma tauri]|uniref:Aminotransferase n=2 Tax=Mycoplasma tauri TaxID=547987 RepID=A0A953T9D4_9MOLU|nr:aminotransferase class I/II-fold pyridoxal phosphate-dependent enzyme [Mycoplasma tauri]MBZ4195149.1 aminotransferase class I/II-fold pyridoxal phosphate-dependent enzyme [Mycoplasma tauri]MBZ4204507.1 aminotransferase class I/II-fold pyridoxal phosphate-dependent enzyme [Mycoplasma tauri]MBZ4218148.1 aminotransferase class I/II-fold pyridoxal phosphate-dependent enzyme [Mycoplasma tauri]MBZ4226856.1 aminotransferase class I/II-fold pyridoxal phosphate-dependent enzyme [Mycoplasma tauri]QSB